MSLLKKSQHLLSSSSSSSKIPSTFAYNNGLHGNALTVNMNHVRDNIIAIKNFQTPSQEEQTQFNYQPPELMAVVKDNAYSTDMLQMVHHLLDNDKTCPVVDGFMVAHFSEARTLRHCHQLDQDKLAKEKRLMAIYAEPEDYEEACALGVETTVDNPQRIEMLGKAAKRVGKPAKVHLHINTGMNRLGSLPDQALDLAKQIARGVEDRQFEFVGLKTHLSTADETDNDFCFEQEREFHETIDKILNCDEIRNVPEAKPQIIHSQNTAWALRYQPWKDERYHELNMKDWPRRMLRVGIGMYGFCAPEVENTKLLKEAVTIRSRIASIHEPKPGAPISYARKFRAPMTASAANSDGKPFKIATVPQGYGEGVLKWPGHFVCIRGKQCPIVGKITMDFFMVDVTELGDDVQCGDSVLLFGKEEEVEENLGSEVNVYAASSAQETSPHQFLARGGYRLKRVYIPMTP